MNKTLPRQLTSCFFIAILGISALAEDTLKPILGGVDPSHFERTTTPFTKTSPFHIGLSFKNVKQKEAAAFVDTLSDPNSPNFHKFITQSEYGQRFGAPQGDVDAVAAYLKSKGLSKVDVTENRLFIRAEATASELQAAFHVTVVNFVRPNAAESGLPPTFYAPSQSPTLPADIAARVTAIHGISDYFQARPGVRLRRKSN